MTIDRSIPLFLTRLRPLLAVLLCLAVCSVMTGRAHAANARPAGQRDAEAMTPSPRPPLPPPVHSFTELLWRFETGGSVESTPAVADGVLYVASTDPSLLALDASDGELLWRYRTGQAVPFSPTVAEGVVYVGWSDRHFRALDAATGDLLWASKTDGRPEPSAPVVVDGTIYFNTDRGLLHALDAATGELLWQAEPRTSDDSAPAVAGGIAYIGAGDRNLYAFDASTGAELWRFPTAGGLSGSPIVNGEAVYFTSHGREYGPDNVEGRVYALDAASGKQIWSFASSYPNPGLVVSKDAVYFQTYRGVTALDAASGNPLPHFQAEDIWGTPLTVVDGVLYSFGFYAMDAASGDTLWRFVTEGEEQSAPAVADGVVYVGDASGYIYALAVEPSHPGAQPMATEGATEYELVEPRWQIGRAHV